MGKSETSESQTELLVEALASRLASDSPDLTDEELAVFESDASTSKISQETADAVYEELARFLRPDENPETAKAFLLSFAVWVQRQRKMKGRLSHTVESSKVE